MRGGASIVLDEEAIEKERKRKDKRRDTKTVEAVRISI